MRLSEAKDSPLKSLSIDLGVATADGGLSQSILLINDTDESFHFDEIKTSCSCQVIKPMSGSLRPGGSASFDIVFKESAILKTQMAVGRFVFVSQQRPILEVNYTTENHNVVSFAARNASCVVKAGSRESVASIPIYLGTRVKLDELRLNLEGESNEVAIKEFKRRLDALHVVVAVPERSTGRLRTALTIRDQEDNILDSIPLTIAFADPVKLIPKVLRFKEHPSGFQATAFIKINSVNQLEGKPIISVMKQPAGYLVAIDQIESVGASAYRLKLLAHLSADQEAETSTSVVETSTATPSSLTLVIDAGDPFQIDARTLGL